MLSSSEGQLLLCVQQEVRMPLRGLSFQESQNVRTYGIVREAVPSISPTRAWCFWIMLISPIVWLAKEGSRHAVRSTTRTVTVPSIGTAAQRLTPNVQPRSTLVVLLPRQPRLFLKPIQLDLTLADLLIEFRLQLFVGLIRPQSTRRKRFGRKSNSCFFQLVT